MFESQEFRDVRLREGVTRMATKKLVRSSSIKRAKATKKSSVRSARKAPAVGKAGSGLLGPAIHIDPPPGTGISTT